VCWMRITNTDSCDDVTSTGNRSEEKQMIMTSNEKPDCAVVIAVSDFTTIAITSTSTCIGCILI
jgi:hypothetical protein